MRPEGSKRAVPRRGRFRAKTSRRSRFKASAPLLPPEKSLPPGLTGGCRRRRRMREPGGAIQRDNTICNLRIRSARTSAAPVGKPSSAGLCPTLSPGGRRSPPAAARRFKKEGPRPPFEGALRRGSLRRRPVDSAQAPRLAYFAIDRGHCQEMFLFCPAGTRGAPARLPAGSLGCHGFARPLPSNEP